VCECKVAGADCLRRKKGRDSEKRTMVKVLLQLWPVVAA
jgi:hypothetical protein